MAGLIGVGLYFLPSLVAVARHTHNATGIFLFNLFLGWTGIGWIIALLVAICSSPWYYSYYPPYPPGGYAPPGAYSSQGTYFPQGAYPTPRHWY